MLTQLRANRLSRNRNFELFDRPDARRALRVHLLLRQLERHLHACGSETTIRALPQESGDLVVEINDPSLRLRRSVYLSRDEFALLVQDPAIARLFPGLPY